jgi:hypothetical protein
MYSWKGVTLVFGSKAKPGNKPFGLEAKQQKSETKWSEKKMWSKIMQKLF